jgi:dynein heavy chain
MFVSYVGRVRKNIHMIIAMSPLGEIFRSRLRKFPSLVNNCTIDWFSEWPEEALLGVGRGQIEAAELDLGESMDACVEMFTIIHQSVFKESNIFLETMGRYNYVTPTSFLEQLVAYGKILKKQRKTVGDQKMRLVKGLDVLEKAQIEIDILKKQISEAAPELAKTKAEVQETVKIIEAEKKDADEERAIVSKDEAIATQQEEEANELLATAQVELDKALPALEAATAILNKLDKGDFYTLQGIKLPTPAVVAGMECACVMLGVKANKKVPENQKI